MRLDMLCIASCSVGYWREVLRFLTFRHFASVQHFVRGPSCVQRFVRAHNVRFADFGSERFRDFVSSICRFRVSASGSRQEMRPVRQGDAATRAGSGCGNTAHWNSPGVLTIFWLIKQKAEYKVFSFSYKFIRLLFLLEFTNPEIMKYMNVGLATWAIWTAACDPVKVISCSIFSVQIIPLLFPSPSFNSLQFYETMNVSKTIQNYWLCLSNWSNMIWM